MERVIHSSHSETCYPILVLMECSYFDKSMKKSDILAVNFFGYRTWFDVGTKTLNATFDDFSLTGSVSEPSTTALLGLGGLALILRRRK
jgi:hypothetical protein